MADEKNTDVKATSEELNDEALNETSGGFEIHNKYYVVHQVSRLGLRRSRRSHFAYWADAREEMLQVRRYKR